MAGLNFQTQTIINANVDKDSKNAVLFEAKKVKVDGVEKDVLKVKRDFLFVKDNVKAIRKAEGHEAVMCEATVDFDKITEIKNFTKSAETPKLYCRLDVYLGVEGAEPFIYSTPWVQKGMPFWVEFTVTEDNKANVATHVADMIKKNNLFQVDKDLIEVSVEGNKLTLKGANEYQRFRKIEVNVFDAYADYAEKVAELVKKTKDAAGVENTAAVAAAAVAEVEKGKNSFGTYSQIVKDLRLPTIENSHWLHIRQAETPVIGAIYDQYIIEYCAPASNEGLGAVGQKLESHTTHVFWVNKNAAAVDAKGATTTVGALWDAAIKTIDPDGGDLDAENLAPTVEERLSELETE